MDKNDEFDLDFDFDQEYGYDAADDDGELDLDFVNSLLGEDDESEPATPPQPEETLDEELEIDLNDPIFESDVPVTAPEEPVEQPAFEYVAPQEETPAPPVQETPAQQTEGAEDPARPPRPKRRRRKKTKLQIFKETYLPYAIMGVAALLCILFIVGSIGRSIDGKDREEQLQKESESLAQEQAAQAAKIDQLKNDAQALAAGYDYAGAVELLESFGDISPYSELVSLKAEYSLQLSQLQEWKDPAEIPNLSFHVLIADPSRAFTAKTFGSKYNRNFVTTQEFENILEQLYENGYVLVSLNDAVVATENSDGTVSYSSGIIKLPSGKKPIMLTETLVNYFDYMIDSDNDGKPDKDGAGFASRLVLKNGEIKAEMVDASGETVIGNYDLVPILEDFIAEHPDFSYHGARAILAVTGKEGVFGYRVNDGDKDEIAGAKELVEALRNKGYLIACNTYENRNYNADTAVAIKADLQMWDAKITPVLGDVDILVYAQGADISEYSGYKFEALYSSGFRYFIGAATTPTAELTTQYFHQKRLMVTGNQMAYSSSTFAKYFNAMAILDTTRGTVPN